MKEAGQKKSDDNEENDAISKSLSGFPNDFQRVLCNVRFSNFVEIADTFSFGKNLQIKHI